MDENKGILEIKTFGNGLDNWKNMLILGDNLEILKKLLSNNSIRGKIKLIYIDPPFSTNQEFRKGTNRVSTISSSLDDGIAYSDMVVGLEYFKFMKERLEVLREFLAHDGSIYLHIDYKIGHYIKILMDEIFGIENFISDITRIKCNPKNFSRKAFGNIKDMILLYSKTSEYIWNDPREKFTEEDISRLFSKIDKDGRFYTTNPLHAPGETRNGATGMPWRGLMPPSGRHWRLPPEELEKLNTEGLIEWSSRGVPRKKIYADEISKRGMKIQDFWEFKDPPHPSYPTEKNLEMLKTIVGTSSNASDIVLDAFCGSGTSLVAAEELERKWIGMDNSPVAIRTAIEIIVALNRYKTFSLHSNASVQRA